MASASAKLPEEIAALPAWIRDTVEFSDSFRFEALTLLGKAKDSIAAVEAKPPADSAAAATAVLEPLHLSLKALLAAKGVRSRSVRSSIELVRVLYPDEVSPDVLEGYVAAQSMKAQGAKAVAAAKSFLEAASRIAGSAR